MKETALGLYQSGGVQWSWLQWQWSIVSPSSMDGPLDTCLHADRSQVDVHV